MWLPPRWDKNGRESHRSLSRQMIADQRRRRSSNRTAPAIFQKRILSVFRHAAIQGEMISLQGLADGQEQNGGEDDGYNGIEHRCGEFGNDIYRCSGGLPALEVDTLDVALEQIGQGIGNGAGGRAEDCLTVAALFLSNPEDQAGEQTVNALHQEGQPCLGNIDGVKHIKNGGAKTGGQTTQPGAKQQAGQGAEDISQMERGGAANGDGQPDPQRGAHKDQGSHQSGEDDFSCRELSFLFHFSFLPKSDAAIIAASGHKKSIRIIMKNRARQIQIDKEKGGNGVYRFCKRCYNGKQRDKPCSNCKFVQKKGIFIMRLICAKDYEDVSRKAANIIAAQIQLKPDCVLGLATGSSPIGTYKQLIAKYESGDLDFSKVRTVNLDEYVGLTKDHDQSYAYFMRTNLFDHVNIDQANCNIPNGMNPDAEAECARYDAVIDSFGGADLQLLGLGPNGHIGFNEPSDSFVKNTNKVKLTDSTIDANQRFFEKREDVPTHAYTMGIGGIMKAKRVLLVVNGANKAQAVKDCFFGPIKPQAPGSILQLHPDFTLVADEAALSLVKDLL